MEIVDIAILLSVGFVAGALGGLLGIVVRSS